MYIKQNEIFSIWRVDYMDKIAVLFPGQGSQYIGMGKNLYDKFDIAKKIFDAANEILTFNLSKLCFDGSLNELTKTSNAQSALLTVSYIMYKTFIELDKKCLHKYSEFYRL